MLPFRSFSRSASKARRDRVEIALVDANRFRLFQAVAGEITNDKVRAS